MVEVIAYGVIEQMLSDYIKRVVEKASSRKKLSDWEMGILMIDHSRSVLGAKIDGLEARVSDLESRMERLEAGMDNLKVRMGKFEDKIEGFEERINARIDNIWKDLGSLRENVINVLVAELKRRMEREVP